MITIYTATQAHAFSVTLCTNPEIMRSHWEEFSPRAADVDDCATTLLAEKFRAKLFCILGQDDVDFEDSPTAWTRGRYSDCANWGMQFEEDGNVIPGHVYKHAEVLLNWAFGAALADVRNWVRGECAALAEVEG